MTRSTPAIAAALIAVSTVFPSAAEACISCDHIPVVVRGSLTPGVVTRFAERRFYYRPYHYRPYRYRRWRWRRRYGGRRQW
jgi:hypothetical protein